ncbi:response regulator transcription factor [Kribbella albertanoniae]|uniref:Response regulator transcription factor n=1 Tax=Kribbella albertanoniae TaxID=1266829 RepID=A0A4R4QH48_9ACTN|nr:response regulator transcription factor [Kribbella albertanoniae]TDC35046.1 response regulator transcription factor [Kribbella albertanoniae]
MIRVLLVDDQSLVRSGFASILTGVDDIQIAGTASDGVEAIEQARATEPDVILMDIRMPRMNGLEATKRLTSDPATENARIVILTTFELDEYVFDALRSGAWGFLLKHCRPEDLIEAVRLTAAGDAMLAPSVTRRLVAEYARRAQSPPQNHRYREDLLTERELEVATLVAKGLDNDAIAGRLFLSVATVRSHVSRAMTKLNVRNRAQLVIFAYETGLVAPGWDNNAAPDVGRPPAPG